MQPETVVQKNGETSVSEHQLEGKAIGNINKEKYKGKVVDRKGDGASLGSLLQKLPRCVNRDLIDQLTVRTDIIFCISVHLRQLCPVIL